MATENETGAVYISDGVPMKKEPDGKLLAWDDKKKRWEPAWWKGALWDYWYAHKLDPDGMKELGITP